MKNRSVSNLCLAKAKMLDLIIIPGKAYPYELPRYQRPSDLDLSKQWLVRFNVWSEREHCLVLKRARVVGDTVIQRDAKAKQMIREITEALKAGAFVDPLPEGTVIEDGKRIMSMIVALDEYLDEKRITLKKQSKSTYEKWGRYFTEFLVAKNLIDLPLPEFGNEHASDMRRYALNDQKMGNKTFNSYKGFVSGIFNHFRPVYKLSSNPIAETIKTLKTKASKHIAYSTAQISDYKKASEDLGLPELWFFVQVIYYTFARPNEEVRQMQAGDVREDHIVIYADQSKTGHRTVMIPAPLEEVFKEWKIRDLPPHYYLFSHNGKPGPTRVSISYMYDKHIKVIEKMELKNSGYDIYGWKHTGNIALYKATKDIMLLKEQNGHSDIKQTVEYLRALGVLHYSHGINRFPKI